MLLNPFQTALRRRRKTTLHSNLFCFHGEVDITQQGFAGCKLDAGDPVFEESK